MDRQRSQRPIFQTAGLGIFFALAPHIAGWLLEKVTDLTIVLLDFLLARVRKLVGSAIRQNALLP